MAEFVDNMLPILFALTIGFFTGQNYAFKKMKRNDQ